MVIEPTFTPDNRYVVFRARKDGKRFVAVADSTGKVIHEYPPYDMVFRPVFTADGKSVAYGIVDGTKLVWKVDAL
jgi:Tol biopolymer transport system component